MFLNCACVYMCKLTLVLSTGDTFSLLYFIQTLEWLAEPVTSTKKYCTSFQFLLFVAPQSKRGLTKQNVVCMNEEIIWFLRGSASSRWNQERRVGKTQTNTISIQCNTTCCDAFGNAQFWGGQRCLAFQTSATSYCKSISFRMEKEILYTVGCVNTYETNHLTGSDSVD